MATLIARIDFFSPLWENGDLERILCNSDKNQIISWLQNTCACIPEKVDLDDVFEENIIDCSGYLVTYHDGGMIEEFKLYEK